MAELFSYIDPRGVETLINDGTYRWLSGHVGLGMQTAAPIGERSPAIDGVTYYGIYTPAREIVLGLEMQYTTQADLIAAERALRSTVSPYITSASTYVQTYGTFRVIRGSATRDIDALCVGYEEVSTDREVFHAKRVLRFWCPDPFFYDPTLQTGSYAMPVSSGLSIPLSIPVSLAAAAATGSIYVTNAGDADTWPTIVIDGPSDNPVITNVTTNRLIDITQAMDANDTLTIDMEAATVTFWDNSESTNTSALAGLSATSEFWPLVKGENEISILVDNPAGGSIDVLWYNRYLGA